MKSHGSKRKVRTLNDGEEKKHLDMLNLAYDKWGNEEDWRKKYVQPGFSARDNTLVVEESGEWAGGGTAWFREAVLKNDKRLKVYTAGDLYVLPNYRGKGIYSTAMKDLNKMASERGAALAFAFPSIYRVPSLALQKYGFVSVIYPKTYVYTLKPEKFLLYVISEVGKMYFPARFDGMTIKLTVRFDSPQGKRSLSKTFRVEGGTLSETTEPEKIDLRVTMSVGTLLRISSMFYLRKRGLFLTVLAALLRRNLGIRFSLSFLKAIIRL